jgi:azurin
MRSIAMIILSQIALCSFTQAGAVTSLALSTKGSEIAYNKTKLTANAGAVEITFKNASSQDAAMPHNVVILKPGTSVDEIASASITAGAAKNYVADSPAVLAHTAILDAGKSEKLVLTLEPGIYPYFCSYPGHAALMKGTLTVK